MEFVSRSKLSDYEWDPQLKDWNRPDLDRDVLKQLSERSTLNGLWRMGVFVFFVVASAAAAIYVSRISIWLAIPLIYVYYFFYGFWVAIGHELQHKIIFAESADWFSEIVFFLVQTIMWNSPRYARVSHRLHHRYTMVRGIDPETDWPEVFTRKWVWGYLLDLISKILIVGAVVQLFRDVWLQVKRVAGVKDRMMREHCTNADIKAIRIESLAILLIHIAIVAAAVWYRRWELIIFITIAWQIGNGIEFLWHQTEHIGRIYNVKDQRLCTRSIKVSPLIRLIYWGLDDHVDHHMFPIVPSRNLPKLHKMLKKDLPEPKTMIQCWREIFAIAQEKDKHPEHEYVPIAL